MHIHIWTDLVEAATEVAWLPALHQEVASKIKMAISLDLEEAYLASAEARVGVIISRHL